MSHRVSTPDCIDQQTSVQLHCELHWRSASATHCDSFIANRINLWRDLLPTIIADDLLGQPLGYHQQYQFSSGELLPPPDERQIFRLAPRQFNQHFTGRGVITPRSGRFYPRGMLKALPNIFTENRFPFRMINFAHHSDYASSGAHPFYADLNHPLAYYPVEIRLTVSGLAAQGAEHGGRCHDLIELLTANGPGMQTRWRDQPTDFWSDMPFVRKDSRPDAVFYAEPRLVTHIDSAAQAELTRLYAQLIPAGSAVLDLMASWQSHLPPAITLASVTGLGLNQQELDANERLTTRVVHDLNTQPQLPFAAAQFDVVVCSLSIEYLLDPIAVLQDVARVLKPGGRCIVSFSNRWFPTKAVHVWDDIHEFERPGLVLEYFLTAGGFTELETFSLRGLSRPEDDRYAGQMTLADPIYAVWARRAHSE